MPLTFECPNCQKRLRARDGAAGRTARCPNCQTVVPIPATPAPALAVARAAETENRPPSGAAALSNTQMYDPPIRSEVPTPAPGVKTDTPVGGSASGNAGLQHTFIGTPGSGTPRSDGVMDPEWPEVPGYEILGELGRGGMGVVYKARQKTLDRVVAIKAVLVAPSGGPNDLSRFEKEALAIARLRHPNLVTAFDFTRVDRRLFLVMELLEGETLEARIDRTSRVDEASVWLIVRQAAAGLAHATDLGIVHRDLKPSNLFLVEPPAGSLLPPGQPQVKVTDFGLALVSSGPDSQRITQPGIALGTPQYMAPEQFAGSTVDIRADMYSLGATALHALTGQPPFSGESVWEIMTGKLSQELPSLERLDGCAGPESKALLAAMMSREPDGRPGSYPELIARIDRLPVVQAMALNWGSSPRIAAREPRGGSAVTAGGWAARGFAAARAHPRLSAGAVVLLLLLIFLGVRTVRNPASPIQVSPPQASALPDASAGPSSAGSPSAAAPGYVAGGWAQPLFDGSTLTDWRVNEGSWQPEADDEGGKILQGRGIIRRPLPPLPAYRVTVGVDRRQATAVEVHFGIRKGGAPDAPRSVLRLAAEGVSLLTRAGDRGPMTLLVPARQVQAPEAANPYREVRVERHGLTWMVWYDGTFLGNARAAATDESEFRIVTEGGPARFDALEIALLVKKE